MGLITAAFTALSSLAKELGMSVAADLLKDNIRKGYDIILDKTNTRKSYRRKLLIELKSMPFIYRNIDSDIFKDYVVIEGVTIDINTMKESSSRSLSSIVHKKRVIFFGNAGIGKTTFFRHSALSILTSNPQEHLTDAQNLLPIFIQLKAVNNFDRSPIVNYILKEIKYFKTKNGKERLLKLAKSQKLFIMLDGYDEIGFVESTNYISHELNVLMQGNRFSIPNYSYLEKELAPLYEALSACKVWLSTRKEFFTLNPLAITAQRRGYDPRRGIDLDHNFISLALKGLGNNRLRLAKIIFDKYKASSQLFRERLDEEKFYNDLLLTNDDKLIELSKNPLFLTIMCYLYVDKVAKSELIEEKWISNSYELINDCIRTLLTDLDKFKVREMKGAHKFSFEQRRSSYFEEKQDFLRHLALKSYIDGKNVIHRDYIKKCAVDYFTFSSKSPNRGVILKHIKGSSDLANSNLVKQIIYSGIFILIPGSTPVYDFPHRRFKETLALEALNESEAFYLDALNKNLGEFIQIFFQNKPARRREVAVKILDSLENNGADYKYLNQLLINCLTTTPDFDCTSIIENKILYWVANNSKVSISSELIGLCNFGPELIQKFHILESNSENYNSQSLLLGVLLSNYKSTLAKSHFDFGTPKSSNVQTVLRNVYRLAFEEHSPTTLVSIFNECVDSEDFGGALSVFLIDRINQDLYISFKNQVINSLGWRHKFPALYILMAFKPKEFSQLEGDRIFQYNPKIAYNFKFFSYYMGSREGKVNLLTSKIHANLKDELSQTRRDIANLLAQNSGIHTGERGSTDNAEFSRNLEAKEDTLRKLQEVLSELSEFDSDQYESNLSRFNAIPRNIHEIVAPGIYF